MKRPAFSVPRSPHRWRAWAAACRAHPVRLGLAGLLLILSMTLGCVDLLLAEPLRRWAQQAMNAQLKGYTVTIGGARIHLWKLGFELDQLTVVQTSHPTPPVAEFGALVYNMQMGGVLHFKVAGKLTIERPSLHINLAQIQEEAETHGSLKNRGWQGALEGIYPIKLNQVRINDGSLLYLDAGSADRPLQVTRVFLVAENVRNIAAAKGTLPSPVTLDAVLFDAGKVSFKGAADFMREPFLAAAGELHLARVPLDRLRPLAEAYQLKTTGGFLSVDGSLAYGPEVQKATLRTVLLEDLKVDYVTSAATRPQEALHGREAARLAKRLRDAPEFVLQVDTLHLAHAELGFKDLTAKPSYRLFVSGLDLKVENLSNHADHGRSTFQARGAFMGNGTARIDGGSRLTAKPADFQMRMALDNARLADLNPFLNAHLGFDVAGGLFSMYSELTVKNERVEGYLKPLVRDLKIYDRAKDHGKPLGKRVKMHLLQFLAGLFKNHGTQEVATVVRISGSTRSPASSEWQVIRGLISNGLFKAVQPGFVDPHPSK